MKCYLDSSVVLRKLLRQSSALREWSQWTFAVSSRLLRLECLRTLHRFHLRQHFDDTEFAQILGKFQVLYETLQILPVTELVLRRAEQPFAVAVGALDSIHLATALLWRETRGEEFVVATHDRELALAATAHGFTVIGAG